MSHPEMPDFKMLRLEREIWHTAGSTGALHGTRLQIAGVDEAGRGPLAGPVVAAAVILPQGFGQSDMISQASDDTATRQLHTIRDSKTLNEGKRLDLDQVIRRSCIWSIAEASVAEIDALNIHKATLLAMQRALEGLSEQPDVALVDGKFVPETRINARPIVKGDSLSLSIAAASILAKTARDQIMARLDLDYPGYGWMSNKGYPSKQHRDALADLGPTPHHRTSYAPVQRALYCRH